LSAENYAKTAVLSRDKIATWLSDLGTVVGKSFRLNDEGLFVSEDAEGNEFVISVPSEESPLVYLYSPLSDLPEKGCESFYEQLLGWNLYGLETQLATLSVDREARKVVLYYAFPIEILDAVAFVNLFDNFVESAIKVKSQVQSAAERPSSEETLPVREISSLRKIWQIRG
jgi:hypothetical protein